VAKSDQDLAALRTKATETDAQLTKVTEERDRAKESVKKLKDQLDTLRKNLGR
jgi:peptidoglycan hydrolase CwlO-like protein